MDDDPLGEHRRQLAVRPVDLAQERVALALDPVAGRRRSGVAASSRVDDEQEGPVGKEAANRVEVQLEHALDAEAARDALVGERRVEVAVADDVRAPLERGPDHLGHELGAGGREERRLGPRRDLVAAEDELAHALAELRPAGLARRTTSRPAPRGAPQAARPASSCPSRRGPRR